MPVNNQQVCLPPVGIFNHVMFILHYLFHHWPWKAPLGEWSIKVLLLSLSLSLSLLLIPQYWLTQSESGTVRVNCVDHKHNTVNPASFQTQMACFRVQHINHFTPVYPRYWRVRTEYFTHWVFDNHFEQHWPSPMLGSSLWQSSIKKCQQI